MPVDAPAGRGRTADSGTRRRILIVDDNRDSADSMAILLAMQGYEVRQAYHGREALAVAADFQPDAALLDIGLPEMSGHELGARLREVPGLDHVVLVAMSGYGQEHDRQRSVAAGFSHHLVKPVDLDVLHRLLADI